MNSDQKPNTAKSTKVAPASFIKLAMRNMVRKGDQSIKHFLITAFGLISLIILLATISRPNLPN